LLRTFSPAFRRTREAKAVPEVLHIGLSLVSGYGKGKGRKKFFTPYLFSRGHFLQPSEEYREAKPAPEVLHAGLSLVSGYCKGKGRKKFFTPYLFSRGCFLQPSENTGKRNRCKRFFTADSDCARAREQVLPRFIAPYAGREFGRTGGPVVGSMS
jgi:lysozyme family protein